MTSLLVSNHPVSVDTGVRAPPPVAELTPIGCGRADYAASWIAPLFRDVLDNVMLPAAFRDALGPDRAVQH